MAARPAPAEAPTTVEDLVQEVSSQLGPIFEQMEWAEDEIAQAQRRHPARADLLWTTFRLLVPTQDLMRTEFVYRSHCRELLERVARGKDTRPGTSAELGIVCCHTSLLAPLTTAGSGLYLRVWAKAFPDRPVLDDRGEQLEHYEALKGSVIDEHEAVMRRKLSQPWRQLDTAPEQTELVL
jgi:hypothetical protein